MNSVTGQICSCSFAQGLHVNLVFISPSFILLALLFAFLVCLKIVIILRNLQTVCFQSFHLTLKVNQIYSCISCLDFRPKYILKQIQMPLYYFENAIKVNTNQQKQCNVQNCGCITDLKHMQRVLTTRETSKQKTESILPVTGARADLRQLKKIICLTTLSYAIILATFRII